MKIEIDLTPNEEAALRGWLGFYQLNPQFIGVPPPPNAAPPITWQTRIVLDSSTRARFDQIAAQFTPPTPGPTPTPEPTPGDPLARFNAAPSQWAKWYQGFLEPSEQGALLAKYDQNDVHRHINWWDGEGYKLQGRRDGNAYWFYVPKPTPPGGDPNGFYGFDEVKDAGGTADAYVKAELAKPSPEFPSGRPMIAPLG